ncbi:DsbC family protein [Candidatus Magnetobacterium casense]|uniref:DsbC family protein n=1 Tax=Candidatus Magnetobacterium casense TaxID=1455061 RepID=A0ABS6RXQ1_9BACT|nr:DsbC family protein [Candidatus Magnetobacterium casensis]MBV6341398.1 DsbC family protein [Candidatus Magnetobacterium casensis]
MNNKGLAISRMTQYIVIWVVCMIFMALTQMPAQAADNPPTVGQPKKVNIVIDKAVRIGMGRNIVVEFTDPDCPYCRKLADYMNKRKDVTRYVFLFPLTQIHPQAQEKSVFILCSKNNAKALEDVMSGKYDKEKIPPCKNPQEATQLLEEHKQMATSVGVTSTPTLIVNGQRVNGADFALIEKIIGPNPYQ